MTTFSNNKLTMVSIFTSIIALLLVALVIWVHLSTQQHVQQLQFKLQSMQKDVDNAKSLSPEIAQLHEHIQRIEEKLSATEAKPSSATLPTSVIKTITLNTAVQKLEQTTKVDIAPTPNAQWMVIIASFDHLEKAKKYQQSKKSSELHSIITRVKLKNGTWYRIVRSGFTDQASAMAFTQKIKKLGFRNAWIQRRP
ncbi:MAG: SPOR domain-containing protein [Mariprofundaceae bacterium]|nr:SPOR domain-containing protein [Mariprofundaceae bacterium]